MSPIELGALSVVAIVLLVYLGVYVGVVLAVVSFAAVWILRGGHETAQSLLVIAAEESVAQYLLGVIPLFVLMGLLASASDLGRDSYEVANRIFRGIRGGLGIATVAANTVFAAITGVSIASAAVFARVAVPEMLRYGYDPRFAVGVVAGSSVLGMLIPPSVLLIVYALLAEQSVGAMFIAGIVPGLVLAAAYCLLIFVWGRLRPTHFGGAPAPGTAATPLEASFVELLAKLGPSAFLIVVVMGGIYGGIFTATEAGAAGALATLGIALVRRKLTLHKFWEVLIETGQITASILFLVVAATMYSRMLGLSGLPTQLSNWIGTIDAGLPQILAIYLVLLIALGTIIDSMSIILITVPLFLPLVKPLGADLVWFGIVTVIAVEIGLLTPPFGISVFVVRSALAETRISLGDVFVGAAPFAATMFLVLLLIVFVPKISLILL